MSDPREFERLPGWEREIGSDRSMSLRAFARAIYEHARAELARDEAPPEAEADE